ncbi:transcription factor bHLH143-like [Cicer arietinum]|uniref:Transcription factor bHLH143-like n=1 Tax=Cicer arietinum TaxID=3827 RepID=A0A1S2X9H0_CICAR|nr:transcription factor bHLH143-like [Cicer arietinum]
MVKHYESWPCPQHVAWPSLYMNCAPDHGLCGHSSYLNPSASTFPAVSAFPGFTAHATPSLRTDQTNEVQGFIQDPKTEPCLKEMHISGATQNANPASLQKKFIIFDQSGNKTRLFYSPVFPLVQSPIVTTKQFAQADDVNREVRATSYAQKHLPKYTFPEESEKDQDHVVNEESEMHEDTEEINALLCSDDCDYDSDDYDDEVTSTGHSPLATEKTNLMQEQIEDTKEDVASSDRPNKRHKLVDGGYMRLQLPADSAGSVRLNEPCECVSDAESKYSGSQMCSARGTEEDNSVVGDIQLKKDKIRKTLRALENITPGAKGKHPLLVIDETIDYLKSLMSQTGMIGVKYHH